MMLFDPRAALAEIRNQGPTPATPATSATPSAQYSLHVAKVAGVAAPQRKAIKAVDAREISPTDDMRHGFASNGYPQTWTGNIVSLAEWRGLTEWQKHGPDGRKWCGVCRIWTANCQHTAKEK
jgi:hypothetical protein